MKNSISIRFLILFCFFCVSASNKCPSFVHKQPFFIGIEGNFCFSFFDLNLKFSDAHEFCGERGGLVPYCSIMNSLRLYKNGLSDALESSHSKIIGFWSQGVFNCARIDLASGRVTNDLCSETRYVACQFDIVYGQIEDSINSTNAISPNLSSSAPSALIKSPDTKSKPKLTLIGIITLAVFLGFAFIGTIVTISVTISKRSSKPFQIDFVDPKDVDINLMVDIETMKEAA